MKEQYVILLEEGGVYKQVDDRRFFTLEEAQEGISHFIGYGDQRGVRICKYLRAVKVDNPTPTKDELIPVHTLDDDLKVVVSYYPKELVPDWVEPEHLSGNIKACIAGI